MPRAIKRSARGYDFKEDDMVMPWTHSTLVLKTADRGSGVGHMSPNIKTKGGGGCFWLYIYSSVLYGYATIGVITLCAMWWGQLRENDVTMTWQGRDNDVMVCTGTAHAWSRLWRDNDVTMTWQWNDNDVTMTSWYCAGAAPAWRRPGCRAGGTCSAILSTTWWTIHSSSGPSSFSSLPPG